MTLRTATCLRQSAARFREMAAEGDDFHLQASLLEVADAFDREADSVPGDRFQYAAFGGLDQHVTSTSARDSI
jgi:hypothetical protein